MNKETNNEQREKYYLHYFRRTDIPALTEEELEQESAEIYARIRPAQVGRPRRLWYAAAAIVATLGIGLVVHSSATRDIAANPSLAATPGAEIGPAVRAATLELADGTRLSLSGLKDGHIAGQRGVSISKLSGDILLYTKQAATPAEENTIEFNTLSTVKGQQYQVCLPDGTKVWLNAASSITFPASFAHQKRREVRLTGEAYFEVAKDKEHPFIVNTQKQKVEVLGTHFNISAYADEATAKTTLLEGSVRVSNERETRVLLPGQQSQATKGDIAVSRTDLKESVAWKNGEFIFNNEALSDILKEVARWYSIEVIQLADHKDLRLSGTISRTKNLSTVLRALEMTGNITFRVEGKKVYVVK
ncbi:FecR family protein [Pedobacter deserti]|uniref:FecR family protein n=1 Tax=Pedobacter deserti TaxID=2817382 RepID=UPI00210BCD4F|nr:FecR domain-containing protein [Pedobacter sp. SYSU D00382]